MSKAGNSYYYLQDELGSPMYMTGTDGVAVSSYAFDDFVLSYDDQGNRTQIERSRRELDDISGQYSYEYDLVNRLTQVSLNGSQLRSYTYDAYGNRSTFEENGITTKYTYDVLDRLLESVNESEKAKYTYDNRSNQTSIIENGTITKTFAFDAANMLAKVTDERKGKASYTYNGFGKRVAVTKPEEKIEYVLDLTKDYHNMLERSVNGETESYVYDSNVVSMTKKGNDYYYMLDELGTGMYLTGTDGIVTDTYAYDEFGRSLNPYTGKEKPKYQKQGNIIQPLAFTGYQTDEITDSYFVQARYYNARNGRFVSEDKVRGYKNRPDSINHYLYCYNRPIKLIDLNGREPIDEEFVPSFTTIYNGYDDAKARYDEECEKNSSGKTLEELQAEYYEGIPDYTDAIDTWVSGQEKFFDEIYDDIATAGPGGLYSIAELYYQFYEHVKTGGSMDIKQERSWTEAFAEYGIPYPGDGGLFVYHGQVKCSLEQQILLAMSSINI